MSGNNNHFFTPTRIMCFFATVLLSVAAAMSFNYTPNFYTVIPKPQITVFAVNLLCALCCFYLVISPENFKVQCAVLFIQAIFATLTRFEFLGTFLYTAFIILCFCNGVFKTRLREKIFVIIFIWFLVLILFGYSCIKNNPQRGVYQFLLETATSVFFVSFYFYVYKKLESLLLTLVPAKQKVVSSIKMPPVGSEIKLSDYELTKRQKVLLLEYLATESSYDVLSKKLNISTSLVKKEMSIIFTKFNVSNIKELHILLLQYIVKE